MRRKRLISLVLAAVMVLGLAACTRTGNEKDVTESTNGEHEPITT